MAYISEGYVYIAEFDNGNIKVGRSKSNPEERIKVHEKTMSLTGSMLTNKWVSNLHFNSNKTESELIRFISPNSIGTREWCNGINFHELRTHAEGLDFLYSKPETKENKDFGDLPKTLASLFYRETDCLWISSLAKAEIAQEILINNGWQLSEFKCISGTNITEFQLIIGIGIYDEIVDPLDLIDSLLYSQYECKLDDEMNIFSDALSKSVKNIKIKLNGE